MGLAARGGVGEGQADGFAARVDLEPVSRWGLLARSFADDTSRLEAFRSLHHVLQAAPFLNAPTAVERLVIECLSALRIEPWTSPGAIGLSENINLPLIRSLLGREAEARLDEQAVDLRRSNAELEQFAYVASHDLQEPLRKVASFCQLLEKRYGDQLDERGIEYIGYAVDGAKRMQVLINDLLAFSRVGRLGAERALVSMDDVAADARKNLDAAIEEVRSAIDALVERGDRIGTAESREVLETVRMFAHDKGWLRRMREAVGSGLTAEAAVERVQSDNRARMMRQSDPYLRERLHDLDDLANRVLRTLIGPEAAGALVLPENAILVARTMGPAALLDYEASTLRGIVLEEGGPTSHVAIVARALGIPAVGEVENAAALCDAGDAIIVDGVAGEIHVRPGPEVEAAYAEMVRLRARRQEQYRALRDVPAQTRDGVRVGLHLNAGLLVDFSHLQETGAEGVGLFRTELQFMVAQRMPSAAEQEELYRKVFAASAGKSVTVRTLDIGGDKILPYMAKLEEENPALGWRAIRIGLDRPALLRMQLRALLKAADGDPLKIMFPMVATVDEFVRARGIVEREKAYLRRHGYRLPTDCRLGAMIEVPSLLFQIDEIAKEADFLSVGSNDLMQFLFAVDRENRRVADRFDPLSVAALRAFRLIAERANAASCPVTVCGEIGGRPLDAMALIGLGYRQLSMSPAAIGPVKAMVLSLDAAAVAELIDAEMARMHDGDSLRPALTAFAHAHGIPI